MLASETRDLLAPDWYSPIDEVEDRERRGTRPAPRSGPVPRNACGLGPHRPPAGRPPTGRVASLPTTRRSRGRRRVCGERVRQRLEALVAEAANLDSHDRLLAKGTNNARLYGPARRERRDRDWCRVSPTAEVGQATTTTPPLVEARPNSRRWQRRATSLSARSEELLALGLRTHFRSPWVHVSGRQGVDFP